MDSTMTRTKRHLAYFSKSFLRDKVAISFLLLIVCTIIAIIYVGTLPNKNMK